MIRQRFFEDLYTDDLLWWRLVIGLYDVDYALYYVK